MARAAKRRETARRKPKARVNRLVPSAVHHAPAVKRVASATVPLEIGHPTKAVIFELETLALDQGRKRVFESAKQTLSSAGFSLPPMLFCKIGIECAPSSFLAVAMQSLKVRVPRQPRLKAAFDEGCRKALCEKPALKDGMREVLAEIRAHGIRSVAISLLGEAMASELMSATGLAGMDVELVLGKGWVVHPYHENVFNRVVNRLGVLPANCVTLVSSGAAAESALCAGTRVVAVPDPFTSYQGFSGVDEVLDTWSPEAVKSVLSLDGEGHG